jgi:hypothetical protein
MCKREGYGVEQALAHILAVPPPALAWKPVAKYLNLIRNRECNPSARSGARTLKTFPDSFSAVDRGVQSALPGELDHLAAQFLYAIGATGWAFAELFEHDGLGLVAVQEPFESRQ